MPVKSIDGKVFKTHAEARKHNSQVKRHTRLEVFNYGSIIPDKQTNRMRRVNSDGTLTEVRPIHQRTNYIGGNSLEARQKYYDLDKEFTDSVRSISKRYGLSPELVASRIAREGPIDEAIRTYNGINGKKNKQLLISEYQPEVNGMIWGLDDAYSNIQNGNVKITTSAPYNYELLDMENEYGTPKQSIYSPQWWFGIENTAAELKYRRDVMKKQFPGKNEEFYDRAANAAFNYGINGATRRIKQGEQFNGYKPFIKINKKKLGGRYTLEEV